MPPVPVPEPRPCVCGGEPIAPIAGSDHAIAAAINTHARTDQRHLAWSALLYLDRGPIARPDVPVQLHQVDDVAELAR